MIHIENIFNTHTTLLKRVKKSILADVNVSKTFKQAIRKMKTWQQLNQYMLNCQECELIASILSNHGVSSGERDDVNNIYYKLD